MKSFNATATFINTTTYFDLPQDGFFPIDWGKKNPGLVVIAMTQR
jgi:hypothetical protein